MQRSLCRGELPGVARGIRGLSRSPTDPAPPGARNSGAMSAPPVSSKPSSLPSRQSPAYAFSNLTSGCAANARTKNGSSFGRIQVANSASASLRPFLRIVNSSRTRCPTTNEPKNSTARSTRSRRSRGPSAYAVAVRDYTSGFQFSLNGDRVFHAASTIKVAILLAVLKAVDEGRTQAGRPAACSESLPQRSRRQRLQARSFNSDGYPQLYRSIGRTAKIGDLADTMITSSSNLATNLLLDFIGTE